ncbi:MAG: BACON domain-containing protein, partial [Bacteroides sp.]|nr:BACON domain-containing protein [Bacteroides sp.]
MMKLYTFILALFLISCGSSEDSKEAPPQSTEPNITCQPESLSFPAIGEEEKVKIKSTTAWEATSNSDWCTITPKKGFAGESLVSLKVMPNEGLNERQATITFHSGEYKKEFIVTQGNDEVIFKILPEHLSFEPKVEKKELSVLSANTWTVQSSDNWLQVSPQQGDAGESPLIVQVSNNETQEER